MDFPFFFRLRFLEDNSIGEIVLLYDISRRRERKKEIRERESWRENETKRARETAFKRKDIRRGRPAVLEYRL